MKTREVRKKLEAIHLELYQIAARLVEMNCELLRIEITTEVPDDLGAALEKLPVVSDEELGGEE